jgi:hypothetical protein
MNAPSIFVCRIDGTQVGEFSEREFQAKLGKGEFPADDYYYWYEGMPDWRPLSQYRSLARTQRISLAPPMQRTMKIERASSDASAEAEVKTKPITSRFFDRLRRKKVQRPS